MKRTGRLGLAFLGLRQWVLSGGEISPRAPADADADAGSGADRLGPLIEDPKGLLDLPEGFRYHRFSAAGETMDDGLVVPGRHDGMGVFPMPDGRTLLIRNHELEPHQAALSAFGEDLRGLNQAIMEKLYDAGQGVSPGLGGTTSLVYDTANRRLDSHWLSLGGTYRNCAGGITPWGSWISCEESVSPAAGDSERNHGYNFEVSSRVPGQLQKAVPLLAMGRFYHEAVAVDPRSGVVYQTEDRPDGLLYRFLPSTPGRLNEGGVLQALRLKDRFAADTRNWWESGIAMDEAMEADWVTMEDVESPKDDLRYQGRFLKGAAVFARGEGAWFDGESLFFACTNGGRNQLGQIWRLTPGMVSHSGAATNPGFRSSATLELFIESVRDNLVHNADNLTIAPWGDLIVCEDRQPPRFITGVSKDGSAYRLGRARNSELAGPVFSPDGATLFVNLQTTGATLAVTGPWDRIHRNHALNSESVFG